jgi:hypothetical protein
MDLIGLKSEHFAQHVKGGDLTASVWQELGNAHDAGNDLVDIARVFALGIDLGITPKAQGNAKLGARLRRLGLAGDIELAIHIGGAGNGGLRQHLAGPLQKWVCLTQSSTPERELRKFGADT